MREYVTVRVTYHALITPYDGLFISWTECCEPLAGSFQACLARLNGQVAAAQGDTIDCVGALANSKVFEFCKTGGVGGNRREEGIEVVLVSAIWCKE